MAHSESLVVFKGGFVADYVVVERLLDLAQRGATFEVVDDARFKVVPPAVLTDADKMFLRLRRDEARAVVGYMLTPERAM